MARTAFGIVAKKGRRIAIVRRAPRRLDEVRRRRASDGTPHQTKDFAECQKCRRNKVASLGIKTIPNANDDPTQGIIPGDGQNSVVGIAKRSRCAFNAATPPRSSTTSNRRESLTKNCFTIRLTCKVFVIDATTANEQRTTNNGTNKNPAGQLDGVLKCDRGVVVGPCGAARVSRVNVNFCG